MWPSNMREESYDNRVKREQYPLSAFAKNDTMSNSDYSEKDQNLIKSWKQYLANRSEGNHKGEGCLTCGIGADRSDTDSYCKNESCSRCGGTQHYAASMTKEHSIDVKASGNMRSDGGMHHSRGCGHQQRQRSSCSSCGSMMHNKNEWGSWNNSCEDRNTEDDRRSSRFNSMSNSNLHEGQDSYSKEMRSQSNGRQGGGNRYGGQQRDMNMMGISNNSYHHNDDYRQGRDRSSRMMGYQNSYSEHTATDGRAGYENVPYSEQRRRSVSRGGNDGRRSTSNSPSRQSNHKW